MRFLRTQDLYFLTVITLIKAVSWFSSPKSKELLVRIIASAAYIFSRNKRQSSKNNLCQVFGEKLSEYHKRKIIKGAFAEFWKETFSLIPTNFEKNTIKSANPTGVEHLQKALKNGKGAILWESSSFGRRNLAKQILQQKGFFIHQVHSENHLAGFRHGRDSPTWVLQHIIKPFFDEHEKQFVGEIINIPNSDSLAFTRTLLDRLKQNAIICITGDVPLGQKLIPQKFLGQNILFPTGMVSLAKISGATILPMFCIQEKNNESRLIIENPILIASGVDREGILENGVSQYVSLLESYLRRYPEKHRVWHNLSRQQGWKDPQLRTGINARNR
jgi:lauroyl/myristoyl acyltransferase